MPPTTDTSRLTPAFARVLGLLFLSVFINYIDRSNLSIAAPLIKDELHISASQLGILRFRILLDILLQPASFRMAGRSIRCEVGLRGRLLLWSTATAVTGLIHGLALLLVARIVLGIGESVAYPGYSKIVRIHCPEHRRGFANAVIAAGLALGPSFGMLFGGTIVGSFGWRPFFVVLGLASLPWLLFWLRWMPSTDMSGITKSNSGPGMWEIFQQRSAWGTCLGLFCGNYYLYFMVTWLPYYLLRERHFSMAGMAKTGGAVFLLSALSASLCGWLSDRWIAAGRSPSRVLKGFMIVSLIGVGVFLLGAVVSPGTAGIVFLMLAGVAFGLGSSNIWAITQRLAGRQAVGRWCGIQLFVGNSSGVVAPAVTGLLLDRTGQFFWPFLIVSLFLWAGALCWMFLVGPVEPVEWERRTAATAGETVGSLA